MLAVVGWSIALDPHARSADARRRRRCRRVASAVSAPLVTPDSPSGRHGEPAVGTRLLLVPALLATGSPLATAALLFRLLPVLRGSLAGEPPRTLLVLGLSLFPVGLVSLPLPLATLPAPGPLTTLPVVPLLLSVPLGLLLAAVLLLVVTLALWLLVLSVLLSVLSLPSLLVPATLLG